MKKSHLKIKDPNSLFTGPESLRWRINKSVFAKDKDFMDHKVPNQFSPCGIEALIDKTELNAMDMSQNFIYKNRV